MSRWNIGVDVADITRFRLLSFRENRRFYTRIFTPEEIRHCLSSRDPAPSFAANFSAKEAVYKALNNFFDIKLNQIEIRRDEQGSPHVNLLLNRKETAREPRDKASQPLEIKVSLSHSTSHAIAFAVVFSSKELQEPPATDQKGASR